MDTKNIDRTRLSDDLARYDYDLWRERRTAVGKTEPLWDDMTAAQQFSSREYWTTVSTAVLKCIDQQEEQ